MAFGLAALAPLVGPAMGLAGSLIGGKNKNNPANAAMQHLDRLPGYANENYNPFIGAGREIETKLRPQYEQMAYNPADVLGGFQGQYTDSPGYKYMLDKLNKGAHNTAAASGFLGTNEDVRNRSEMHAGLLDNYMQQYLNNIFGIQNTGLGGLEKRSDRGFAASGALADYLGGYGGAAGAYSAYGKSHQNQGRQDTWNSLSNLINVGMRSGMGGGVGGGFNPGGGGF